MSRASSNQYFLGRCLFFHEKFTRLEVMAQSGQHGWAPIADRRREFPPSGKLFSFDKNTLKCSEGTVRYFRVEENKRTGSNEEHDQYVAVDAHEPIEILDYSHISSVEEVRCALVEDGLAADRAITTEVMVAMRGRSCVRLCLDLDPITGRYRPRDLHALEKLTLFRLALHQLQGARIDGRLFFCPIDAIESIGIVDWSTNADFMQRTLRRLKRFNAFQSEDGMGDVSRRAIEKLAFAVRSGEVLGLDLREVEATKERLHSFVSSVSANISLADAFAVELMKSSTIAAKVEERIAVATESAAARLRADIEPKIRSEILDGLQSQITKHDQLSREVVDLEQTLQQAKADLSKITYDHQLQRMAIASEGRQFLKSFSDVLASVKRYGSEPTAESLPTWNVPRSRDGIEFGLSELKTRLRSLQDEAGFELDQVLEFDIFLRGGEVPLLFGRDVEALLGGYARCVLDGAFWRLSVDPATIGFDDLWSRAATAEPTTLSRAWSAAVADPGTPVLAVIDDISNAPIENWFSQFLRFSQSEERPKNLLFCATVVPSELKPQSKGSLWRAIPFEAKATKAGVVAAIFEEAQGAGQFSAGKIRGSLLGECASDIQVRINAELARVCESQAIARRAVRVFRSALATQDADKALQFACEFAKFQNEPGVVQNPTRHVQRSFTLLSELTGAGE